MSKMTEITNDILQRAAAGEIPAFEKIALRYERLIYSIAFRMFNNAEDAKDISQEVLFKLYKNLHKCREVSGMTNWVYTITNNTCFDELRKRKARITPDSLDEKLRAEDNEIPIQAASDEPSPEDAVIRREVTAGICAAITELPEHFRSMIILRDIQQLSYEEISEVTGINIGTVKSKISRARSQLRKLLPV